MLSAGLLIPGRELAECTGSMDKIRREAAHRHHRLLLFSGSHTAQTPDQEGGLQTERQPSHSDFSEALL